MRRSGNPAPLRSRLVPNGDGERSRLAATEGLRFPGVFLGAGSYGEVHLHDEERTGKQVVLKTVIRRERWSREDLIAEVEVMQALDHPYVLRILSWYEVGDSLGMVLDFCGGGELMDTVREGRRTQKLTERWPAAVFSQLLEALAYCHSRGYVHKDIKAENILLLRKPPEGAHVFDVHPHIVLADFGLAESVGTGGVISLFSHRGHEVAGTGYTMAPEVWKGSCGFKADVWSLGVVMFQLFSNKIPFDPPDAVLDPLPHALRANVWLDLHKKGPQWSNMGASKDATAICKEMLKVKERDRPTAQKLRDHAWIKDNIKWWQATPEEVQAVCQSFSDWRKRHPLQKAMCLSLAANVAQDTRLAAVFSLLDKDHNGTLSKTELADGLLASKVDGSTAKKTAVSLDFDEAGAVSYLEFVAARLPSTGELYDSLLLGEFNRWTSHNRAGTGLTSGQLDALLENLMDIGDFDVDPPELSKGNEGPVTFEEFSAFFGSRQPVPYKGPVKRRRRSVAGGSKSDRHVKSKKSTKSTKSSTSTSSAPKRKRAPVEPMGIVVPDAPMRQLKETKSSSEDDDSDWDWTDSDEEDEEERSHSEGGSSVAGGRRRDAAGEGGSAGAASDCTVRSGVKAEMRPSVSTATGRSGPKDLRSTTAASTGAGGGSDGSPRLDTLSSPPTPTGSHQAAGPAAAKGAGGGGSPASGRSTGAPGSPGQARDAVAAAGSPRVGGGAPSAAAPRAAAEATKEQKPASSTGAPATGADAAAGAPRQVAASSPSPERTSKLVPLPTLEFDALMVGGGRGEQRHSFDQRVALLGAEMAAGAGDPGGEAGASRVAVERGVSRIVPLGEVAPWDHDFGRVAGKLDSGLASFSIRGPRPVVVSL